MSSGKWLPLCLGLNVLKGKLYSYGMRREDGVFAAINYSNVKQFEELDTVHHYNIQVIQTYIYIHTHTHIYIYIYIYIYMCVIGILEQSSLVYYISIRNYTK